MTRRRPVPEPKPVPPDLILEAYDGDYRYFCPVCGERSHWGGHYDLTTTARAQALRTAARHAHYLATYAERFNTLPRHTPEFRTRAREAVK